MTTNEHSLVLVPILPGSLIVCLRCLILMVFVVAGHLCGDHCFSSMLDLDAICRGRKDFWKSLLAFDAWFWCYLWCSRALDHFIVCLRCLILMVFVVAGRTFKSHCLPSMLDALIQGGGHFWKTGCGCIAANASYTSIHEMMNNCWSILELCCCNW